MLVAGNVVKAAVDEHDTMSVFLSDVLDLQRWQAIIVLITLLICSLLIQIWFFSSKATTCCAEARQPTQPKPAAALPSQNSNCKIQSCPSHCSGTCAPREPRGLRQVRALLGCGPDPTPCLGFSGDCGDLQAQFTGVAPQLPDDWYCAAFPDDNSQRDTYLVGLISAAVAFPVTGILSLLFDLSNDVERPGSWVENGIPPWQQILLDPAGGDDAARGWHWTFPPPHVETAPDGSELVINEFEPGEGNPDGLVLGRKKAMTPQFKWYLLNGDTPVLLLLLDWATAAAVMLGLSGGDGSEDGEAEEGEGEEDFEKRLDDELEEAKASSVKARRLTVAALFCVLVIWTLMARPTPTSSSAASLKPRARDFCLDAGLVHSCIRAHHLHAAGQRCGGACTSTPHAHPVSLLRVPD